MSNSSSQAEMARRYFLGQCTGIGLCAVALSLLESGNRVLAESNTQAMGLADLPHHQPRAKSVIYLTQSGGPSQIELFDHKPGLPKWAGKELPPSVRQGQRLTTMTANQKQLIMPARTRFQQHGDSGATIGEWLPHHAEVADELCFIKSMVTDQINHAPAMTKMLTGHQIPGRPSIGAWSSYGLGSENRNLPDYLVLISKMKRPSDQPLYDHYWGSGFLPSRYQGVKLRNSKDPVLYLRDPDGLPRHLRRGMLSGINELNQRRFQQTGDPEIETRIQQYEMAWRMQTSIPELTDLSDEPESTFELYGPDSRRPGSYAANCILARRLVERGVRFVQLFHPDWDHHSRLSSWCVARCRDTDQASAALVKDLKQRGLLDETLVLWGGEFGRGVAGQGKWNSPEGGRDHHPRCFTMWAAGGGVKSGITHGATDEFSYNAVVNPVHVRDLHATVMRLLGIDHERFTYRFQGLDFKLTGVEESRVVTDILA
ncbi:MAG: sulfatase [Planctomycetaceae bacterium]|nr:sulfatase [Planctomycetaceae bacterium]